MTFIECCEKVRSEGVMLIRPRKGCHLEYDCKEHEGNKKGWVFLDATTAAVVCKVYEAVNDTAKAKMETLTAEKCISVSWKVCK